MKKVYLLLLAFLLGSSYQMALSQETVTIGTQVWMLRNLDVTHYRNGDSILQVNNDVEWVNMTTGAWCNYFGQQGYGKLYNWYAVNDPRGLAPEGWHIPTDTEWSILAEYLGGNNLAGGKLKETGTTHWNPDNVGATNESGFTALPGGYRGGQFRDYGFSTSWWTTTAYNNNLAWRTGCVYDNGTLYREYYDKYYGFSVRCISDYSISTSSLSSSSICGGNQISVPFTISGTFNSGNTFTAQLSDASGSFANPVSIGTLSGTSAGTINATIPVNTPSGTGYRIRVVSSNPAFSGTNNGTNLTINPKPSPSINGNSTACENEILTYSTASNAGRTYKWTISNGTIQGADNEASVNIKMGTSDSTVLKLVETISATGCADSTNKKVTLNLLPSPSIQGSNVVCKKSVSTYTTSNVSGHIYKWFITNGLIQGSDSASSVVVKWDTLASGTLKVVETSSEGCRDSSSINITLNPLPTPRISPTSGTCEYNTEIYSSPLVAGNKYKWAVIGGSIIGSDSSNTVTITWDSAGIGSLKLSEMITSTGCTDSSLQDITINPLPSVSINGPREACYNSTADFNIVYKAGYSYLWTATSANVIGSNTNNNVTIGFVNPDTVSLKLIVTNNSTGCKDSATKFIIVNPLPNPQISGTSSVCEKNEYIYSSNAVSSTEYQWSVSNGVIVGNNNERLVRVRWETVGNSSIKLIHKNITTGCKDSVNTDISVHALPVVKINGFQQVRKGSTEIYTASGGNVQNEWTITNGVIYGQSNTASISVIWNDEDSGSVKLVQTDLESGCKDSAFIPVEILSSSEIIISGLKSVCVKHLELYSTPHQTERTNLWSVKKGGTISGPNDSNYIVVYWEDIGAGEIMLIQTNKSNGIKDTASITVTINPLPVATITGTDTSSVNKIEKYSSVVEPSILNFWSASNGDIQGNSNLNDVYILWNKVGNAKVKLIKVNSQTGCSDSSTMDVVVASVNAVDDQPSGLNQVSITPNPAENSISISFPVNAGISVKFILYDISGRALIKEDRSIEGYGDYSLVIDTSDLDSGIYYATIWTNGVVTTKKVVVIH